MTQKRSWYKDKKHLKIQNYKLDHFLFLFHFEKNSLVKEIAP